MGFNIVIFMLELEELLKDADMLPDDRAEAIEAFLQEGLAYYKQCKA